jgi:hypothetical protein
MGLFKFPFRKVTTSIPIDWAQWRLSQSVRNLHFEADADGDVYALPVMIIDPTQGPSVLSGEIRAPEWIANVNCPGIADYIIHDTPVWRQTSYVHGIYVDYRDAVVGAAAPCFVNFHARDDIGPPPTMNIPHWFLVPVAAVPRASFVLQFAKPLAFSSGLRVMNMTNFGATSINCGAWGYDL